MDALNKRELLAILERETARDPLRMTYRERAEWATVLAITCERLADMSRRRANSLESAYWDTASEAMLARRPRMGLRRTPRDGLTEDEGRRARINAGTMLGRDPRFKDACNANEMYNRWAAQYAAIATASAQMVLVMDK